MSNNNLRERLQEAIAMIDSDPAEAKKQIWALFKDMKKPDVVT